MVEPLRHRQTKEAENTHVRSNAAAPHPYSTSADIPADDLIGSNTAEYSIPPQSLYRRSSGERAARPMQAALGYFSRHTALMEIGGGARLAPSTSHCAVEMRAAHLSISSF
jgi:hypothetical protein